jgi:O-acetyl-ADP-ribose deacetylase (regulator of RNase III)
VWLCRGFCGSDNICEPRGALRMSVQEDFIDMSENLCEVVGDLLESSEQYIVHQTNCRTRGALGLAKLVFERFPHSNVYRLRNEDSDPGTIDVCDKEGRRGVINLMGQLGGGSPSSGEMRKNRVAYFKKGLLSIAKLPQLRSVAFPHGIGCGLAGGCWPLYRSMIAAFAAKVPDVEVVIYKLPETKRKIWSSVLARQQRQVRGSGGGGGGRRRRKKMWKKEKWF